MAGAQPADVLDRFGSPPAQLAEQRVRPCRVGPNEIARGVGLEGHPGQHGAEAVVQITPPPPLLLPSGNDAFPRTLDGLG
jgi:hypothetical protein